MLVLLAAVFVLLLAVFFSFKAPAMVMIVSWYVISGPLFLLIRKTRERHGTAPAGAIDDSPASDRKLA